MTNPSAAHASLLIKVTEERDEARAEVERLRERLRVADCGAERWTPPWPCDDRPDGRCTLHGCYAAEQAYHAGRDVQRQLAEALKKYGHHIASDCAPMYGCRCGLEAALAAAREEP